MAGKIHKFINRKEFRDWNERMFYKFEKNRISCIIDFLSAEENEFVLDIGCGSARLSKTIKSGKYFGIDISGHLLSRAKEGTKYVVKAEGEHLPYKEQSFHKAVCSEVLEHVIDPEIILNEASRVLRKNGIFVVSLPNERHINFAKKLFFWVNLFRKKSNDTYNFALRMDKARHIHHFDLAKFKNIIAGKFEIEKIKYLPLRLFPLRYVIKCKSISCINYETEFFDELSVLRKRNFFYSGRAKILKELLKKYSVFSKLTDKKALVIDIGFGHGNRLFANLSGKKLIGVDINLDTLLRLKKKQDNDNTVFINADINNLPFKESFDVVFLMDVLEHVSYDSAAMANVFQICKKRARVIVTVPALRNLFGEFDRLVMHKRRYTKNELADLLNGVGFRIEKISYFIFFLMPLIYLYRIIREWLITNRIYGLKNASEAIELKTVPILNTLCFYTLLLESAILKRIDFPFGISLLAIANKDKDVQW